MGQLRGAHEAQVGAVLGQYHSLREAVSCYHEDMEAAMAEAAGPTPGRRRASSMGGATPRTLDGR